MPWITPDSKIIGDGDTYISADGTQYPGNWDKSAIAELIHVERPAEPSDPTLAVVGWHVDDDSKWVWETVPVPQPTAEEILARAKAARVAAMSSACRQAILAGYASSALGALYTYPNSGTDQTNMAASVLASLMPDLPADWSTPFWCSDSDGVWLRRLHSGAQIRQAGLDAKAWVTACQERLNGPDGTGGLIARINAATSVAEIEAVAW